PLRGHPRVGRVPLPRGAGPCRGALVRRGAPDPLRRTAGRAGHDVPSRSERKRARVQGVPAPGARVHGMTRASVAVIGAGVVGASVAYHLARRGWRDVLLLDRASRPGLGSTGAATGGFRVQFASDANVRLSLLARERLSAFEQETGVDPGLVAAGYLWLARRAQDLEALRAALAVQKRNGFWDAREIDAREAVALNPAMNPDGILGGTFAGSDGFLRPLAILEGYLRAAEELGVAVRWNAEVTGLRRGESEIEAVRVGADWIR